MSDDPNVIEIRPGVQAPEAMPPADTPPVAGAEPCEHRAFILDPSTQTVQCRRCEAPIDPYDALQIIGRHWDRYASWVTHARAERERYRGEIKRLKEDERRVKSRLRRARRSLEKETGGG